MSASEKLKVLDEQLGTVNDRDERFMVLRNALPRFIALAEAAEWTSESGVYSHERHRALTNALVALGDVLS